MRPVGDVVEDHHVVTSAYFSDGDELVAGLDRAEGVEWITDHQHLSTVGDARAHLLRIEPKTVVGPERDRGHHRALNHRARGEVHVAWIRDEDLVAWVEIRQEGVADSPLSTLYTEHVEALGARTVELDGCD